MKHAYNQHTVIYKLLGLLLLLLLSLESLQGQTPIYKNFGVDEGLPSSEVYDIYQDKQGNIWFATDKGISKYNGYSFENFTTENGLPDNTIIDFYPQKNGQIWCYGLNNKTLFYFEEAFNGFTVYPYNHLIQEALKGNHLIKSLFLDDDKTLYLGGYFNGYLTITKEGSVSKHNDRIIDREEAPIYIGADKKRDSFFRLLKMINHYPTSSFITLRKDLIHGLISN